MINIWNKLTTGYNHKLYICIVKAASNYYRFIMKKVYILVLSLALGLMSFTITHSSISKSITWKTDAVEVGKIPQGIPKKIQFEFKNTGKKAVLITAVKPACGCTAAEYTKTPVAPGKSGFVKAIFNAAAPGPFTKSVTVTTSAEATPMVLKFAGVVIPKK